MDNHHPEQPGSPQHLAEHATNLRFNLGNEFIGSHDRMIHHPTGQIRIVEYKRGNSKESEIRDKLYQHGLIAGELLTDSSEVQQCYRVPKSARPVAYDASSRAAGEFTYNDHKLFTEMGELFALGTLITDSEMVVRGNLGRAVVLVEFTRPDERRLSFVPGIERLFKEFDSSGEVLKYYIERIDRQFGYRSARASRFFEAGFNDVIKYFEGESNDESRE